MSFVFQPSDESLERALFEQRARAEGGAAASQVPSLDAVLRAAGVEPAESPRARRGRTLGGLALAAACVLTVMKTHPRERPSPPIVADARAESMASFEVGGGTCEDRPISACTSGSSCSAVASLLPRAPEARACVAPLAMSSSSGALSCGTDDAVRSELR